MALSKREKRLLILAFIIIVGVSVIKFVIQPGFNHYLVLQSRAAEGEFELQKSNLIIRDKDKYRNLLEDTNSELKQIKSLFYQKEILEAKLEFMEDVDKLIIESGLKIKSKEVRVDHPESLPVVISYCLNLTGTTINLVDFLESFNAMDGYYRICEMNLKSSSSDDRLSIYLVIETYCIGGGNDETENRNNTDSNKLNNDH